MKRWLNVLFLLFVFALPMAVDDDAQIACPPAPENEMAGTCEEWLHFSDGDVVVCLSDASVLTVESQGAESHAE